MINNILSAIRAASYEHKPNEKLSVSMSTLTTLAEELEALRLALEQKEHVIHELKRKLIEAQMQKTINSLSMYM